MTFTLSYVILPELNWDPDDSDVGNRPVLFEAQHVKAGCWSPGSHIKVSSVADEYDVILSRVVIVLPCLQ